MLKFSLCDWQLLNHLGVSSGNEKRNNFEITLLSALYIVQKFVNILELAMDTEASETCLPNLNQCCVVFLKCLISILLLRKFGNFRYIFIEAVSV